MKGQALITVNKKNGAKEIYNKQNVVFDNPRYILQDIFNNDLEYSNSNYKLNISSSLLDIPKWFGAIKLHDEPVSETDMQDWKYPILLGGNADRVYSANLRYTKEFESIISGNQMSKTWNWNIKNAMSIKSLSLVHEKVASDYSYAFSNGNEKSHRNSLYNRRLNSNYSITTNNGNKIYKLTDEIDLKHSKKIKNEYLIVNGYDSLCNESAIYTLQNNELLCLRYIDDFSTDASNSSSNIYCKYIYIIDALNMQVKRHFPISQFEGCNESYYNLDHICVLSISYGDYLLVTTNGESRVYKIPRTETSEIIPAIKVCTNKFYNTHIVSINNYFVALDYTCGGGFKINPDDTVNEITYPAFNTLSYSGLGGQISHSYGSMMELSNNSGYSDFPIWWNSTALNLDTPINLEEGDTLTVKYTITAN